MMNDFRTFHFLFSFLLFGLAGVHLGPLGHAFEL